MSVWIPVARILETGTLSFSMSSWIVGIITVTSLLKYEGSFGIGIDL